LDNLAGEEWLTADHVDRLRVHYGRQLQRFARPSPVDANCSLEAAETFRRLRHETLTAERLALIDLRNNGTISDEVLHRLEHELDVEALRHGIGERRVTR
jgi:CPA1 family monovalent cation:H+ antiporter